MLGFLTRQASTIVFLGALGGAFGLAEARAGYTVELDSTAPSGGNTLFDYAAAVTGKDTITTGDYFTVIDFAGYVPGSIKAPAGWTATTEMTSSLLTPNFPLTHGDDPAIPNLVFTYNGWTPITSNTAVAGFSAVSIYGNANSFKDFVGTVTSDIGRTVTSFGDINVPTFGFPSPAPAPEPSSLISGGIGVLIFGIGYARRRVRPPGAC